MPENWHKYDLSCGTVGCVYVCVCVCVCVWVRERESVYVWNDDVFVTWQAICEQFADFSSALDAHTRLVDTQHVRQ